MEIKSDRLDSSAKAYFDSLPVVLQEQIMQSGAEMTTKEQLQSYCKNVLNQDCQK